ncbi:MAG: adenylosuccinate lyase [Proteobacteria bacterium]|nr:adenylosuccinate lyase [Pseudomonadota bacterium]
MIERYSRPEMSHLWSEESQYRTWLDIEVLACEGWAKLGKIPASDMKHIRERAGFDLKAVQELEKKTKHDVAAFVSEVQRAIGESGRFVHMGLTSSDVVDTAFAFRLTKSADLIINNLKECLATTRKRAQSDKKVLMMGRTHGIHAEPMTMGMKWLLWHDSLKRALTRLENARTEVAVGKISGAVGNYAHIPPEVEQFVCQKLGLKPDSLSTQVIARDRFAAYVSAIALLASSVESIAVELRHLQRTEVGEVREGFSAGQKGSSAMPHKRNPISAENLTGLARLLRSMVIPAMENCALWHERDISHSSVERVIGPDANILVHYMLWRLNDLLTHLEIFPDRMAENLNLLSGVIYSQNVLLKLIEKGLARDEAYQIVQSNALRALDEKVSFQELLKADSKVAKVLPQVDVDKLFSTESTLKHLDYLYGKVLGNED